MSKVIHRESPLVLLIPFITGIWELFILTSPLMRRVFLRERVPAGLSTDVTLSDFDFFFILGFSKALYLCPCRWQGASLRSERGSVIESYTARPSVERSWI